MRTRLISVFVSLMLVLVFPAVAQEHPEHPEHSEHPEKSKAVDLDALEAAIEAQIAEMAGDDGWVKIQDSVTDQTWTLKLDKVHRERLSKIAPNTYFACVDFDSKSGEKVDVDFFMKGESAETLEMDDLTIHKIDGEPRYTWKEEDGFWKRVDVE